MNDTKTMRAFLAIELDAPALEYLDEISSKLKSCKADVSWVKVSNAHLTLKFLGDITDFSVIAIEEALKGLLEFQRPFELSLKGAGAFPSMEKPRVVWVGIEDKSGMLKNLSNRLEKAFETLGFPPENRAFNPHITLGRVRSASGKPQLLDVISSISKSHGPCFRVTGTTLFRSDLRPSGAVHTPLISFRFEES